MGRDGNSRGQADAKALWLVTPVAVALALVVVAAGAVMAWNNGRLNSVICGGECGAEYAIAPVGVRLAEPGPTSVDRPVASPELEVVMEAARGPLSADVLGNHVGFAITSTEPDSIVVTNTAGTFTPASTTKLLTSFAALAKMDPQQRFKTEVRLLGEQLVLVGGGDPYLTDVREDDDPKVVRADLLTLAERTAAELKELGVTAVSLGYDDTLFEGPKVSDDWPPTYVRDNVVTPIGALWIDRGMIDTSQPETTPRIAKPAEHARDVFANQLRDHGIDVTVDPDLTAAPAKARAVATIASSTVAQIVESTIRTSDDEAAEVLLRQLAIATNRPATFTAGADVVVKTLRGEGISIKDIQLADGSGLSRENRISPTTLVQVVRASLVDARYAPLLEDLPVSGFSGTLADRFNEVSHGWVRAKTGTLTGVHSLAGIALDSEGRPVIFAVMADETDRSNPFGARAALDRVAAVIAGS